MKEVVLFIVSMGAFALSFYSFKEKGFLINSSYTSTQKNQRNSIDKKPHYQQSAIVF